MLKFLSSLSFLYGLAIVILIVYGVVFYKQFSKSSRQRKFFPIVFGIISIACLAFLWMNFHASLSMRSFSNVDHHFIRHDGFIVHKAIVLGRTDTANFPTTPFNHFILEKVEGKIKVTSHYSEEPLYSGDGQSYKLLSKSFPVTNSSVKFRINGKDGSFRANSDDLLQLQIGSENFEVKLPVKRGISVWNAFRNDEAFLSSEAFRIEGISDALSAIYLLRDDVSRKGYGELKYFISAGAVKACEGVSVDGKTVTVDNLQAIEELPDRSVIAWGISFLDNNRNQFRILNGGKDSFSVNPRYPVSYPLSEESGNGVEKATINKFLVSRSQDMLKMPGAFSEGFMFEGIKNDYPTNIEPYLLSYQRGSANQPLNLQLRHLHQPSVLIPVKNDRLVIPSLGENFSWQFSIVNTFNWQFGSLTLNANQWQLILFGSLLLFILLTLATSILRPAEKTSWVWQILACITLVLLTTRFFLYWRYKTFPPYEGMDLPSLQQLNSIWNFAIIVLATIILALVFGYPALRSTWNFVLSKLKIRNAEVKSFDGDRLEHRLAGNSTVRKYGAVRIFFLAWFAVLALAMAAAFASGFDAGVCRHLAIALVIAYFIFSLVSYRHSPLVTSDEKAWWKINTSSIAHIICSNPAKSILSLTLLGTFLFIDIGFAIVFLNFILFNETFLAINYSISGLSAGNRKNATVFGVLGIIYLAGFVANLVYAPYIFSFILNLPDVAYLFLYALMAFYITTVVLRMVTSRVRKRRMMISFGLAVSVFLVAFFFFPKERILSKAAMTRYRIDVMTMPVDKAIESAYAEGKTWQPVIRAAQNQWFINTFIDESNNPHANSVGFNLIQHAPQTKGAKYNAQATDLVASRFFLAEHGTLSVLLYVLLLLLPLSMLASFYKLYPDFSNRINPTYPLITSGFSILNYLLITALLVILAATGRYIFFGQDLPFGSILSKQSILFPSLLIILAVMVFRKIPLEYYANRRKIIPGASIFVLLAGMLFFMRPDFNRNKEFNVPGLATRMEDFVQLQLQPVLDHFDTSRSTRRLSLSAKDRLFTDSLKKMLDAGIIETSNNFFLKEVLSYSRADLRRHFDQNRMLYLDLYSGSPKLAVNQNYFRIEAPPHLQETWRGNVFGDSSHYNVTVWNAATGGLSMERISMLNNDPELAIGSGLKLSLRGQVSENLYSSLYLVNGSPDELKIRISGSNSSLKNGDSIRISNPWEATVTGKNNEEILISVSPDAYMKNYYVNGSRFYVYPLGNKFIWARNFAESVSIDYSKSGEREKNAIISLDFDLMDSLSSRMRRMLQTDSSYKIGAEYAIAVADGNGRLIAMTDEIEGFTRPDPNDKAGFNATIMGENGMVSQSLLRKQIGNINLLRMNPGPGSTLKPILFAAIASQLPIEWEQFSSQGFTGEQEYFGGEKVKAYDFELNNGRISSVADFIRTSDNYYYSNVLLFGSYPKTEFSRLLADKFKVSNPSTGIHWPNFTYSGKTYWLDGYENWPGYANGKVNLGSDSSFTSIGLNRNFDGVVRQNGRHYEMFRTSYDSSLFNNSSARSGFILPESFIFDQYGDNVDKRIPYDVFANCLRGHVKGSSQVLMPPVKMLESIGRLFSQNRNFSLTLNPYAGEPQFRPFDVDSRIRYNSYLDYLRTGIFTGMSQVLNNGTATRLGSLIKKDRGYYYYAKTGTTGDNDSKTKSKLMTLTISKRDVTHPDFNFRNNKFYTIYFTMQNGPAKQNEEFIASVVDVIEKSEAFIKYMR